VDILSDMVINPLIRSGEVEKEKGVIKAEIDMYEDLPMRKVYEILRIWFIKAVCTSKMM
jgi:predicted Zn-dependent peptidase